MPTILSIAVAAIKKKLFEQQHLEQMAQRQARDGKTSEKKIAKARHQSTALLSSYGIEKGRVFLCMWLPDFSTPLVQARLWPAALHGYPNPISAKGQCISVLPVLAASS